MTTVQTAPARRVFVRQLAAATAAVALPSLGRAQATTPSAGRRFAPQPGRWRSFEVTTRVDIARADGVTRVWLPIPSVNTDWQRIDSELPQVVGLHNVAGIACPTPLP